MFADMVCVYPIPTQLRGVTCWYRSAFEIVAWRRSANYPLPISVLMTGAQCCVPSITAPPNVDVPLLAFLGLVNAADGDLVASFQVYIGFLIFVRAGRHDV